MANPSEGNKPVQHKKHLARLQREQQQTRLILYTFIAIIVIVAGLLGYGYYDQKYLQPRKPVARVGNVDITTVDFQARVRLLKQSLAQNYQLYQQYAQYGLDVSTQLSQIQQTLSDPSKLGQQVLDQMINEEIIRQEAAKRGITVSTADVDARVHEIYGYFPNGSPTPTLVPPTSTPFNTPTYQPETLKLLTPTSRYTATAVPPTATPTLVADLITTGTPASSGTEAPSSTPTAESTATMTPANGPTATITPTASQVPTATPYTEEGFKKLYQDNMTGYATVGLDEAHYRKLVETDLLRTKLYDIITADVTTDQEQVWARHILVNTEADAKTVEDRLAKGEDFAKVAVELSKDPGSGPQGGDLGWFGRGAMVAAFEDAAFSLKVGEISQPIKSDFGYHIIQVLGHQKRPIPDSDLKKAKDTAFSDWLQKARPSFNVQTFDIWLQVMPTDATPQAN